jgi:hypothetical protein
MRTFVRTLTQITVGPALVALVALTAQAQPPRQTGQMGRARQACDNAAAQAGYRVMRRDRENVNGGTYQLPMHVSHGSNESDVTCSYDTQRGVATVPPWVDRNGNTDSRNANVANGRYGRGRASPERAQRLCENYVNGRRGYQVVSVGTPTQHGQRQWDVPVTLRRNGRGDQSMTCRYNTANGKLSLH